MGSFPTKVKLLDTISEVATHETDILIVPVYQKSTESKAHNTQKSADTDTENKTTLEWTPTHQALDKAMGGYLKETLDEEAFKGGCGKLRIFRPQKTDKLKARWVIVLGLGSSDKLTLQKATQAFCSGFKGTFDFQKVHTVEVVIPSGGKKLSVLQAAQSIVFAAHQATYKTREADAKKIHALKKVTLLPQKGQKISPADLDAACIMAQAEAMTKDLANMPANLKTAESLAEAARSMSDLPGITVSILSDSRKIKKEMPAFWAVAQGAAQVDPPRFIKVRYKPVDTKKIGKKVALVGKGIIFDTGGVQVKTGTSMSDMKFDMTGAATVLSVVKAAAELGLKGIDVTAYVAATKNLTGEEGYLPDSIIDSASGKKIEIGHTDAEGRVTLADAVYAATQDNPDEIVTIATLTGSAGIAVGHCIALMGTDDPLVERIEKSAKAVGEPVQALAFMDEDFENIKSTRDAADLSNTGKGKNRGHMTAGAFVASFAEDVPIAHLDIAGGDAKDGNATGIAVKGLIEYLRNVAS